MREKKTGIRRLLSAALAVLLLVSCAVVTAQAAYSEDGLVVEKMTFRDVLRVYTSQRETFGENAMQTDEYGISNAAKNLAALFTYTVGLNYSGYGSNSDYYGKDITGRMNTDPYTDDNLLAAYEVEIRPYNGGALALAEGQKTDIRVYLVDYVNAANGVEPVLHYVWQDNGSWFAVKDDNPYYRVSFEGESARQMAGSGKALMMTRACGGGTADLEEWRELAGLGEGDGVFHIDGASVVVGQGTANIFGVTDQSAALIKKGGFAPCLLAVSDFVQGDATWQTGPLVYSRQCMQEDNMHMLPDGEILQAGTSYRFRVVYDEALTVSAEGSWSNVPMEIRNEATGALLPVSDFVWYGGQDHLTGDSYNPHVVEFSFTPGAEDFGVCTVSLPTLIGANSALVSAPFHFCLKPGKVELTADEQAEIRESGAAAQGIPVLGVCDANAYVTRLMLAECLWNLAGKPVGELASVFSDMPAAQEQQLAVLWASRSGLIVGYGDGSFGGANAVTREQAAVILSRYAAMRGLPITSAKDINSAMRGLPITSAKDINWYWDGQSVSSWAQAAVLWALEKGVLNTLVEGYIYPADYTKCGDMVNMLTRLTELY